MPQLSQSAFAELALRNMEELSNENASNEQPETIALSTAISELNSINN